MEKKLLFIYNPVSGKAQAKSHLADIVDIFAGKDYSITVHPTKEKNDGFEYIKAHATEYDIISVCGGDGMLNESVSALMHVEKENRPSLAYLPAGSTNDFAGTVGIPSNVRHAAKMAMEGKPFFCDAGQMNDKYFAYVAAFGAFTAVSYRTSQDFKNIFGHFAYILEGIRNLPSIKPIHMRISFDDKFIEDDFIIGMVTNTLQVGGVKFNTGNAISLNDGLFEVLLVKKPQNALKYQSIISSILSQKTDKCEEVISFKAAKLLFESDVPVPWTVDGEFGGETEKVEITNHSRAFSVII